MRITYLHTKFHIPSSNGPIAIAVKLKATLRIHTVDKLLFYIQQKKLTA